MKAKTEAITAKVQQFINDISLEQDICENICAAAKTQFNLPTGQMMDYLSGRKKAAQANIQDLYMICWSYDHVRNTHMVREFFTKNEISELKSLRIDPPKAKFPLRIRCIEVADDQWIGATNVRFFMLLRESQLINYNENTQRTMTRIMRGGVEEWKITLNRSAVNRIKQSYENDSYIPNTITLNIPEDEGNFYYDDETGELVIKSLEHFDISDGYHRYMAMASIWDEDKSFDYPMEIRITHFPVAKAKQFIFQEDQKTPMRRVDSRSMNMTSAANKVTERLNGDPEFIFSGGIQRNEGMISFGDFAACVDYFYFKGRAIKKEEMIRYTNSVKRDLMQQINEIFDGADIKERYDFVDIMILFVGLQMGVGKKVILKCLAKADKIGDKKKFALRTPRRGLVTMVENFIKKEGLYENV